MGSETTYTCDFNPNTRRHAAQFRIRDAKDAASPVTFGTKETCVRHLPKMVLAHFTTHNGEACDIVVQRIPGTTLPTPRKKGVGDEDEEVF
jgi:hypothetical protein